VSVEEITLGAWGLVDGAFTLIESGIPFHCLERQDPFHKAWHFFNIAADGYGWRPLLNEWDYEETLARVRSVPRWLRVLPTATGRISPAVPCFPADPAILAAPLKPPPVPLPEVALSGLFV